MDPSKRRTAKEVGDAFVHQYYDVMKSSPNILHEVYRAESKIGRPEHIHGVVMRFSTLVDVGENLNMLSYGGFESVEITSVVSQDSQNGSVIVNVGGYFTSEEICKRSFTQVFILAPQENGYFVSNDMFRFDDDLVTSTVNKETEVTRKEDADGSLRVSEPKNDTPEDRSKISEGSDVMKAVPKGQAPYVPCDTILNPEINADEFEEPEELFESSAIYFSNLPPDYYPFGQVERAFTMFGPIKKIEIKKEAMGYHYGFVEFEDANSAMWALQASYLWIGGRKVYVKKKRVKGYWMKKKAYEEERRQYNQRRFEEEYLRGKDICRFWKWVKTMEEFGDLQEQYKGTRAYDFWKWQRSVSMLHQEEQRKVEEEEEEEQRELEEVEEQRKLEEEQEQRKLKEEQEQRKLVEEEEERKLVEEGRGGRRTEEA